MSKQTTIKGFPSPARDGDNVLTDFLETHPGWWGRQFLCSTLNIDERTLRLQAEHSHGAVIFSSGGGLCATRHADEVEILNCATELRNRASSHTHRATEIEAFAQIGGGI